MIEIEGRSVEDENEGQSHYPTDIEGLDEEQTQGDKPSFAQPRPRIGYNKCRKEIHK